MINGQKNKQTKDSVARLHMLEEKKSCLLFKQYHNSLILSNA